MGKEGLAQILGHAALDKDFLETLHGNPRQAADELKVHLTKDELKILEEEVGPTGSHYNDLKALHSKLNITYNKPR